MIELLSLQEDFFKQQAAAWFAMGAESYSIWQGETPLLQISNHNNRQDSICDEICVRGTTVGTVRIGGLNDGAARILLRKETVAIEQMLLLQRDLNSLASELVETRDHLMALYNLSQMMHHRLNIQDVLHSLVEELVRLANVESSFAYLTDRSGQRHYAGYPEGRLPVSVIEPFMRLLASQEGQPLVFDDPSQVPNELARNALFMPLFVQEGVSAGFGLLNKRNGDFMSPDIKLVIAIARYLSTQIKNLLMMQAALEWTRVKTEMDLAEHLQLSLLPATRPDIPGLDLGIEFHQADRVGGDFYDYLVMDDNSLIFFVGDVSGKGIAAAMFMAVVRTVIRTQMIHFATMSPARMIELANRFIFDDFYQSGSFCTLFLAHYHPASQRLVFANAGHSPVVFASATRQPEILIANSPPLGVVKEYPVIDQEMTLYEGDALIVGTDGLTDVRDQNGDALGIERFVRQIPPGDGLTAQHIAHDLYRVVEDHRAGGNFRDDQTLIVVKRSTSDANNKDHGT